MDTIPVDFYKSQTRCHLAKVVRADGVIYGYTDTQFKVTFMGLDYLPIDSFVPSAIPQEAGMKLDNWEFTTLNNTTSARIKTDELLAGRYHGARIWLYEIDWMKPANGARIAGQWRLAKARISDSKYALEVRDLLSLANNQQGNVFSLDCPVVMWGDQRCDPHQTIRAANTFASSVLYAVDLFTIDITRTDAAGFYTNGDCLWTSGQNNGLFGGIGRHTKITPAVWGSGTTYAYGDYAIGTDTRVYISLQDANINHNPNANGNPTWWYQLASSPAAVGRLQMKVPIPYTPALGDTLNVCAGCLRQITGSAAGNGCTSFTNSHNPSNTNLENYGGDVLPQSDTMKQVARQAG